MWNPDTILYAAIATVFLAVALLAYALGQIYAGYRVRKRIDEVAKPEQRRKPRLATNIAKPKGRAFRFVESLSRLSLPSEGWQNTNLGLKFIRAGLRQPHMATVYLGTKTVLCIALPLVAIFILLLVDPTTPGKKLTLFGFLFAATGYYAPDFYLRIRTNARLKQAQEALPDMLDLLVISIESGLGMDSAINRVAREIERSSPILAEEFYLTGLEIRAGSGRIEALRNLCLRLPVDDLRSLVSMLAQADKFGTSLGDSLRIQSDAMRVKRAQRAEEIASKIPVKILFPLVFFIFPSLMVVLIGPAAIQISTALLNK